MKAPAAFLYHDSFGQHTLRRDHPMRPVRLQYTFDLLMAYKAFQDSSEQVAPRPATDLELTTFHTREYVDAVNSFSRGERSHDPARFNFSTSGDNPIFPGMYEVALLSTGASLVAAELIHKGEVETAFNIAGGLHHAATGNASGFCVFNDPVIAINYLMKQGMRIAYVDIDAHHGDGVQDAFYESNRVLTISLHESGDYLFPGSGFVEEIGSGPGTGYSINVPLFPYTDDDTYIWAFNQVVVPLVKAFNPDALVTQLGIDAHYKDPLTHLQLTSKAFCHAVKEFSDLHIPWVALGGGGYDVHAVARCWTLAYGLMTGQQWAQNTPPDYAAKHGVFKLRDEESLPTEPGWQNQSQRYARATIESIKRLTFPIHGA